MSKEGSNVGRSSLALKASAIGTVLLYKSSSVSLLEAKGFSTVVEKVFGLKQAERSHGIFQHYINVNFCTCRT